MAYNKSGSHTIYGFLRPGLRHCVRLKRLDWMPYLPRPYTFNCYHYNFCVSYEWKSRIPTWNRCPLKYISKVNWTPLKKSYKNSGIKTAAYYIAIDIFKSLAQKIAPRLFSESKTSRLSVNCIRKDRSIPGIFIWQKIWNFIFQ